MKKALSHTRPANLRENFMIRKFQVGKWSVEPDLNSISKGTQKISVEPKVIEVLAYLADHAGQVLSKEQIIQAVWPDTSVSDEVLRYSISELRRVLKDNARNPRMIQTIARRGYRLIAPVSKQQPAAESRSSLSPIAFPNLTSARDQEYFWMAFRRKLLII
jgi:DNA-binding winged helix-turn-helix (wHTH) protein